MSVTVEDILKLPCLRELVQLLHESERLSGCQMKK